jgi:hypothetical protein
MSLPTLNLKLIYDTLDHIDEHPEEWNQAMFACGTTACFAGHAMLLSGYNLKPTLRCCLHESTEDCLGADKCCYAECRLISPLLCFFRPDGSEVDEEDTEANGLLGFTEDEGAAIFYKGHDRNPRVLRKNVESIIAARQQ